MAKCKKISERELKKVQQNFGRFFEDKDNQLKILNSLVNRGSKTFPCVDVTNPSALLDVAVNPNTPTEEAALAFILLFFFVLFLLLIVSE